MPYWNYLKWLFGGRHKVASDGFSCLCHARPMMRCKDCGNSYFADTGMSSPGCPNCYLLWPKAPAGSVGENWEYSNAVR